MARKVGKPVKKDKILLHRNNRGFTRQGLADAAEVPLESIVKAEFKGRRTNDVVVEKIAAALNISVNALR